MKAHGATSSPLPHSRSGYSVPRRAFQGGVGARLPGNQKQLSWQARRLSEEFLKGEPASYSSLSKADSAKLQVCSIHPTTAKDGLVSKNWIVCVAGGVVGG